MQGSMDGNGSYAMFTCITNYKDVDAILVGSHYDCQSMPVGVHRCVVSLLKLVVRIRSAELLRII